MWVQVLPGSQLQRHQLLLSVKAVKTSPNSWSPYSRYSALPLNLMAMRSTGLHQLTFCHDYLLCFPLNLTPVFQKQVSFMLLLCPVVTIMKTLLFHRAYSEERASSIGPQRPLFSSPIRRLFQKASTATATERHRRGSGLAHGHASQWQSPWWVSLMFICSLWKCKKGSVFCLFLFFLLSLDVSESAQKRLN